MKYYDKLAKYYDKLYKEKYMREVEKKVIMKEVEGLTLDIGCGTGEQLKLLNEGIGLDISLEMAKIAKEKCKKFVVVANSEHLPFKDESFDTVISFFGALNHCNINKAFKEVYRVLKPEGKFIFTVANAYDIKWIVKNLRRKGLKKTLKAVKERRGRLVKYINGERIRVKIRFYSMNEIKEKLLKNNFKIEYSFGANITNSFIDKFIYKSFLKYFGSYIGVVARKC
ncbi:class I SAM-dependent methyltransferase [Methanocaldococcus infernus]